jgi:tyrosine-protein kinase Etk/Wzc
MDDARTCKRDFMKATPEQHELDVSQAPEGMGETDANNNEIDILDLLIVLAKRKWLIVKVTLGAAVIAAIISLLIPNRYTATATIMPPQQTQSTSAMLMSQLAGSGLGSLASLAGKDLGLKNPNDLYIGMLKSRTVEDAIIAKFDFQKVYREKRLSDARKELEKAAEVNSGKDGLINISFEDKDPKRSAEVANAYVDELRILTQHLAVTEASQRRLFFEQQLQQAKDDLADAEVALKETQQKTGMIQLDSQSKAMIEAVGRIRAQISAKEVQLQAMGSFATEQNPDYVMARQELAGLRVQLAKFEQQPSDSGDPLVATGKIPAIGLEYVRRFREVKYREAIFELLAKQYEAAKLDEAKEAAVIQVVDPAVMPDRKSSPKRALIVAGAFLCGLFVGILWAFCAEALSCIIEDGRMRNQFSRLRTHLGLNRRNV